jgi:hypothetical protein
MLFLCFIGAQINQKADEETHIGLSSMLAPTRECDSEITFAKSHGTCRVTFVEVFFPFLIYSTNIFNKTDDTMVTMTKYEYVKIIGLLLFIGRIL